MAYTVTYVAVTWTSGDTITETKMDNMVSNDQCYDAFAAEGMMLNNAIGFSQKDSGGTRRVTDIVDASDIQSLGNTNLTEVALLTRAKARAYKDAADQTVAHATWAKVVLDAETYDVGGDFAGNSFTTPVAGFYDVKVNAQFLNMTVDKSCACAIYINGALYSYADSLNPAANADPVVHHSDTPYVPAAQAIDFYVYHTSGVNEDIKSGSDKTWMSVHLFSMGS